MKPSLSLLDDSFQYIPAAATSVSATWRRFGWRAPSDFEHLPRLARRPTYAARRMDAAAMRKVEVIPVDGQVDLAPWHGQADALVAAWQKAEGPGV